MIGLMRAELIKLLKRKLFWIMAGILVVFTALSAWLICHIRIGFENNRAHVLDGRSL